MTKKSHTNEANIHSSWGGHKTFVADTIYFSKQERGSKLVGLDQGVFRSGALQADELFKLMRSMIFFLKKKSIILTFSGWLNMIKRAENMV